MNTYPTFSPVRPVRVLLVSAMVLVAALGSACSKSDGDAAKKADTPAASSTTTADTEAPDAPETPDDAAVPVGSPSVPELAGSTGAFDDLTVTNCGVEPGKVKAQGTVRNPTDKAADYVLQVRWVARKGNGVLGRDVVVLKDVKADDTVDWTAASTVPKGEVATCSYSLLRGSL